MPEIPIIKLSNELEDAGWMGAAAHVLLGIFYFAEDKPGTTSSTDTGLAWTKKLGEDITAQEFDLGIGKLKVENGLFSATLGVQLKDDVPYHIDLLVSLAGESGVAPAVVFELNREVAFNAPPIKEINPLIPESERSVIGYKSTNHESVKIPIPMVSFEMSFRIDKDNPDAPITSTFQIYNSLDGLANTLSGIIEYDMNKVMVFPKLANTGLYIDKLFLDLSTTATTSFSGLFPEVYNPTWQGIGAKEMTLLFPIDEAKEEFISAGVQGFIYGFDGLLSASFNFQYNNTGADAKLKTVSAEIEIRNNEFIRSEVEVGIDMDKILDQVASEGNAADVSTGTAAEQDLANTTRTRVAAQSPVSINGELRFQVSFVWLQWNNSEVIGFDFIMKGYLANGNPSGLKFSGVAAKAIFWGAGSGLGGGLLGYGIAAEKGGTAFGGAALLMLILADIIATEKANANILPVLEALTISKIGFRFAQVNHADNTFDKYYQAIVGFRTEFKIDCKLLTAVTEIADLLLSDLGAMGDIFGESVNDVKLKGKLDIQFDDFTFPFDMPAEVKLLFKQQDFNITAKKLPELVFDQSASSDSNIPKPVVGVELVTKEIAGTTTDEKEYGISISLKGLASSAFNLDTPAAGIILFVFPEFRFEFAAQTAVLPKFTLLVPPVLLAEGVIDLGKPIPAFGGTQNRVSLEVGVISSNPTSESDLQKISKYKYRFGGEVVWGEAIQKPAGTTLERPYDFLFVEVHYDGDTPLFVIGPVGVFGLGLLFGRNIRPGVEGGQGNAMGIANWILGQQAGGTSEADIFKNVKDWPAVPSGSTWHPEIYFNSVSQTFEDQLTIGVTVTVGSPTDNGETFKGQVIVLVGFPEFWFAIAGIITFKKINTKVTVVVVYDSNTFAIKFVLEFTMNDDGTIVVGKIPFEFGAVKQPFRLWYYIGHYDDAKGGPVSLQFLSGLFAVKAYFVIDSEDLANFGLMPIGDYGRPTLSGPAIGFGVMIQLGPKKYGPSAINITLFAALGLNVGFQMNPFLFFGELYAGGYIQLKVLFLKFKIELLAILAAIAHDNGHQFQGYLIIKLDMPWPIPDFKLEFEFVIQSGNFLNIPAPLFESTGSGMRRLTPMSSPLLDNGSSELPIDGVISIAFDKPIYEILNEDGVIDKTQLLLNDEDPDNDKFSEEMETEYLSVKYIIRFTHVLDNFKVRKRPRGSYGAFTNVQELAATWNLPAIYDTGEPTDDEKKHTTIFLNSLFPPHLQFQAEELGQYLDWSETRSHIKPCEVPETVCINREPRPSLTTDILPQMDFATGMGSVVLREEQMIAPNQFNFSNKGNLEWTPIPDPNIKLPFITLFDVPFPTSAIFHLRLHTTREVSLRQLFNRIFVMTLTFEVKLRGETDAIFITYWMARNNLQSSDCPILLGETSNTNDELIESSLSFNCIDDHIFDFEIILKSLDGVRSIDYIKLRGFECIEPINGNKNLSDWEEYASTKPNYWEIIANTHLILRDFCMIDEQADSRQWGRTEIAGTNAAPSDAAIDTFTDNLLLDPNHEFIVDYVIRSFASVYHVKVQGGTELVNTVEFTASTNPSDSPDTTMNPLTFVTGNEPTQNVRDYLGFTYPSENMQAPYTDGLAPLITFKNQGLILKIYNKYYNSSNVLQPLVVDFEGNEIGPVLDQTITINSGGSDGALGDLLGTCLPQAQDFVKLKINVWDISLNTDTRYSLQLADKHDAANVEIPFTMSFITSKFTNLLAHTVYVESLFDNEIEQIPIIDAAFETTLSNTLAAVAAGTLVGFDDLVDKLYLDLAGIDDGRIGEDGNVDTIAYLIRQNALEVNQVIGVIIELNEPLIGKEGIIVNNKPAFNQHATQGIIVTNNMSIIMDTSGSRLIIFNSNDLNTYNPMIDNMGINITFRPVDSLRKAITDFVALNFINEDAAEQSTRVTAQLNKALAISQVATAMTEKSSILNLKITLL